MGLALLSLVRGRLLVGLLIGTAAVAGLSGDVERYDLLVKVTNGYVKILRG